MFNFNKKHDIEYVDKLIQSRRDLTQTIERSCEEYIKTIKETSANEIEARDRVDISLREYERLKEENQFLKHQLSRMRDIYSKIGFPIEEVKDCIDEDTIRVIYDDSGITLNRNYMITFSVDKHKLRRKENENGAGF